MGLNDFDYIVIAIIAVSGLLALVRGLVRELFSLLAWIGAFVITARYHVLAEPWAHRFIANPNIASYCAILFVFVVTFIVLSIIGALLSGLIQGRALTSIDRSLGFVFGLLRGVLLVCLLYLGAVTILWPDTDRTEEQTIVAQSESPAVTREKTRIVAPDWLLNAKTKPYLAAGAAELRRFIPEKDFGSATFKYLEDKANAQHVKDKLELDRLSTPVNGTGVTRPATGGYDDHTRSGVDHLTAPKANVP